MLYLADPLHRPIYVLGHGERNQIPTLWKIQDAPRKPYQPVRERRRSGLLLLRHYYTTTSSLRDMSALCVARSATKSFSSSVIRCHLATHSLIALIISYVTTGLVFAICASQKDSELASLL
jgi:hypothetical protein